MMQIKVKRAMLEYYAPYRMVDKQAEYGEISTDPRDDQYSCCGKSLYVELEYRVAPPSDIKTSAYLPARLTYTDQLIVDGIMEHVTDLISQHGEEFQQALVHAITTYLIQMHDEEDESGNRPLI